MTTESHAEEQHREMLEREADRARARLMTTIDVLERRGHDAFDVKVQVQRHMGVAMSVVGGAAAIVGGAVAVSAIRARSRRRHKGRERIRALRRLWQNPERAAKYRPRSVLGEVMRRAVVAAMSLLVAEVVKRMLRSSMARPALGERSLVGEPALTPTVSSG